MRASQDLLLLKAFAAELKARRAVLGLSQESIALNADLNRTFVAKLEVAGTAPSLGSLFKLSAALKVEPEELVASVSKRYRREQRNARKQGISAP